MKKLLASLLLLISLPLQTLAASAPYFKPATLYKGQNRQAVFSESEANFLFARGYKLEDKVLGYSVVTAYSTTLSQPMTATQTTVPVSSLSTKDGHTLTMADLGSKVFLTIEPGAAKEEIVMCTTISGTAWATCTRGLAFYGTGVTAVTANQKTHASGSRVVMSNVHYVYEQLTDIDTDQTIAGIKTFTSSPIVPTPTTPTQAANKSYVDGVAQAGGADASASIKGISYLSSNPLVATVPVALNSEEVAVTSSASKIPRANGSGKIDPAYIDGTGNYTFSGNNTYSGTSTFTGTSTFSGATTFTGTTTINGFNVGSYTFGDGSDGDATISALTTSTKDMYYNDLTINSGIVLNPAGYKIFVKGTLTFIGTGKIERNGVNGGNASNQTAGAAPAALAQGTLPGSVAGGVGIIGGANNTAGGNGTTLSTIAPSLGSAGGNGGNGGAMQGFVQTGSGLGGTAPVTLSKKLVHTIVDSITLNEYYSAALAQQLNSNSGGSGGSGGAGNGGTSLGGGSGAGGTAGGMIAVYARNIVTVNGNTYIESIGGNGGNGGAGTVTTGVGGGGGGGGGGGAGGVVVLVYLSKTGTGVITVTGGTGGARGNDAQGSGTMERISVAGTNGTTGNIYLLIAPF